jgi:predicted Holliday junction resolvase-like endonuclease
VTAVILVMSICVVVMIKALLTIRAEQKRIKELENRLDESYRKMEDNLKKLQPRITPQEMMDRTINRVLKNLTKNEG